MTTLAWVLALAALVPAGLCTAYGVRFSHTPGAARAKVLTVLAVVSILVLSAAGYGVLGRFRTGTPVKSTSLRTGSLLPASPKPAAP